MMKKLDSKVKDLIAFELEEANKSNPAFVDCNHGWGVIREEMIEATKEFMKIASHYETMEECILEDCPKMLYNELDSIKKYAIKTACEIIQVGAMAEKFMDYVRNANEND